VRRSTADLARTARQIRLLHLPVLVERDTKVQENDDDFKTQCIGRWGGIGKRSCMDKGNCQIHPRSTINDITRYAATVISA